MSLKQVVYDPALVTDTIIDRFYELSLRPGNRRALMQIMESLDKLNHDPSFSRSITGLSVPTLLMWGKQDKWIPVSHVARWKQDVSGIHTIVYDNTGHVPQMEMPKQVADDMRVWIAKASKLLTREPDSGYAVTSFLPYVGMGFLLLIFLGVVWKIKNQNPRKSI